MRHLLTQLLYEMEEQHDTVLVSIVSESGSTPRGTGSQMLVNSHGRVTGHHRRRPGGKTVRGNGPDLVG